MDWKRKFTSRKFWMALAGFVTAILVFFGFSTSDTEKTGALILAGGSVVSYIFGEAIADRKQEVFNSHTENYFMNPDETEDEEDGSIS